MSVEQANYLLNELQAVKVLESLILGVMLAIVMFMAVPK